MSFPTNYCYYCCENYSQSCFFPRIYSLCSYYHVYIGSEVYLRNTRFGGGSGPIFLSKLRCNGQETNLLGCQHSYFHDIHYCHHDYDAGLKCEGIYKHVTCKIGHDYNDIKIINVIKVINGFRYWWNYNSCYCIGIN